MSYFYLDDEEGESFDDGKNIEDNGGEEQEGGAGDQAKQELQDRALHGKKDGGNGEEGQGNGEGPEGNSTGQEGQGEGLNRDDVHDGLEKESKKQDGQGKKDGKDGKKGSENNSGEGKKPGDSSGNGGKGNNTPGKNGPQNSQQMQNVGKDAAKQQAENQAKQKAVQEGGKAAGKAAASSSATAASSSAVVAGGTASTAGSGGLIGFFATPPGWITLIVIAAIIIITGTVFFFVGMPGQIGQKLKQLGQSFMDACQSLIDGSEHRVDTFQMSKVANYLEGMGYDLKGEGFVTSDKTEDDITKLESKDGEVIEADEQHLDEDQGVIRHNDTDEVTDLNSDPIFTYIVSDNLCYLIKNFNQNLDAATGGHGDALAWIVGLIAVVVAIVFSPVAAFIAVAGAALLFATASNPDWGSGLISIYHEKALGVEGSAYGELERGYIKLDLETKKMQIKRGWTNNAFSYDVDGWGGQYGMPLEFLLSVHVATQMPDLAMEMATAFDTDVKVLLREVNGGEVDAGFKTDTTTLSRDQIYDIATEDNNGFQNFWNWLCGGVEDITGIDTDDGEAVSLTNEALNKLYELGMPHDPDNCECDKNDDGTVKEDTDVCDACKDYIKKIMKALNAVNDDIAGSYTPYISKVTKHWFRDVYFVKYNATSTDVMKNDDDYYYLTEERWTMYETYTNEDREAGNIPEGFDVDDYKLYEYDEDGNYKLSKLSKAEVDARNDAILNGDTSVSRLIKKPISQKLKDNYGGDVWSAYEDTDVVDDDWTTVDVDDDSPEAMQDFKGVLMYKQTRPGDIIQVEDGQRAETNSHIKEMFVNNTYYQYDGTVERANKINENRQQAYKDDGTVDKSKIDKSLTGKVAITKDSLTAFSMLENTHTLDADYAYKNFKELIVELNYFDKEDLSEKVQEVMQWPLPQTPSGGWPLRRYEKGETFYGTLINSKVDLGLLRKRSAEEAAAALEEFNNQNLDAVVGNGAAKEDKTSAIKNQTLEEQLAKNNVEHGAIISNNNKEITSNVFSPAKKEGFSHAGFIKGVATKFTESTSSASEPRQTIDITAENDGDVRYLVTVDGVEYKYYYQFGSSYSGEPFWDGTIASDGCSMSSCANILTGYGNDVTPSDTCGYMKTLAYNAQVAECCEHWDVKGEYFSGLSEQEYYNKACEAISDGKPIIMLMTNGNGGFWTSIGHFIAVAGIDKDGNLITLDPGSGEERRRICTQGLSFACETCVGMYIPEEAPDGSKKEGEFVGYDPEVPVVSPLTGKIIEYGCKDNGKQVKRTNIETGEVEEVDYIKIQAIDKYIYDEKGNAYADYNTTNHNDPDDFDYFEDKITDTTRKNKEGYDYFYDEYQGVCDGFVLYIEGFDLTLFDAEEGAKAIVDSGNEEELSQATMYVANKVNNLDDNVREAQAIWKEDAKSAAIPLIEIDGDLYIKEGTVIGKTTKDPDGKDEVKPTTNEKGEEEYEPNGNYMRLIFRDLEDTIVEDVENYLPLTSVKKTYESDWELFFWLPFESYGTDEDDCGPECFGTCSAGETAAGIIQWTSLGDMNNIVTQFIAGCKEIDSDLCSPLTAYESWTPSNFYSDYNGAKDFQKTLHLICQKDRDGFLGVQMELAKKQYLEPILDDNSWLEDRPSCVQGAVMHLKVWGADYSWISSYQNKSDEEIVKKVRTTIANTGSTAGPASGDETSGRAFNEPEIALKILDGTASEDAVEQWVRKRDMSGLGFTFK